MCFVTETDIRVLIGTQDHDHTIEKMIEDMEEKDKAMKGELKEMKCSTKQFSDVLV